MKRETRKAGLGSIRKWERIVAGEGEDWGVLNCPLCQRFSRPNCYTPFGEQCPVAIDAKAVYCRNTPYHDWLDACYWQGAFPYVAYDDETVMCAVIELEYLKSLLPSRRK